MAKKHKSDFLISIYKEMLFYRRFEEQVNKAYQKGKFSGFCHLHIGQEAVCVGVQRTLRPTDYMISGYRSHTQGMAKGVPPEQVLGELFGKAGGVVGGKGGSMHVISKEFRFLGGHGIVAGQCPIAAGAAFKIRYFKEDDVVICYLGDAATCQGAFHEALNMAGVWDLPVLYIIENNQYGMGTDIRRVTSIDHLWKRALAYDMDHGDVDGMDVLAVYEKVDDIVKKMRKDPKPYLLEANTYRYRGHSVSDPATYRTKEEVKKFHDRDPIQQLGEQLVKEKTATEADLKDWDKEARAQVKEAEKKADDMPIPEISAAYEHVLAE